MAFYLLIAGTMLFSRSFAHLAIRVGELPIYVTEGFIVLWLVFRLPFALQQSAARWRPIVWPIVVFILIGLFRLAIGFGQGAGLTSELRDSALFYYSLFALITLDLLDTKRKREFVLWMMALMPLPMTALIVLQNSAGVEITTSGSVRYLSHAEGLYCAQGALSALFLAFRFKRRRWFLYALAAICASLIVLTQARTFIIAVPAVAAAYIAMRHRSGGSAAAFGLVTVSVLIIAGYFIAQTQSGASLIQLLPDRFQALLDPFNDPNSSWRLLAWNTALDYVAANPVFGLGMGQLDFLPGDVAPHNSLITILYSTGLVGLLAFTVILVQTFRHAAVARRLSTDGRSWTATAAAIWIMTLIVASFNVVLETPYSGIFFWIATGMIFLSQQEAASNLEADSGDVARAASVAWA